MGGKKKVHFPRESLYFGTFFWRYYEANNFHSESVRVSDTVNFGFQLFLEGS